MIKPRVFDRPSSLPPIQQSHLSRVSRHRPYTEFPENESTLHIVAEGEIDPDYLVPAQTTAGDSLAPSSSTMNNDHIPLIPAPPLLTTHRLLQAKLDDIEEKIKECRQRKQLLAEGHQLDTMTEEGLNQMIFQYQGLIAELKSNLNNVRTLYMNAATIPTVLQFGAHVIAYQITLIEAAIFDAIPPLALLEHSSKHPHPRIVASTDFFNYITRYIEHAILLPQEASTRAQLIHYWIKVASRCFDINNYQTLKAIVSALNTPPVQRLKRTWAYTPKKSLTKLEALNDLMSEANNYGQYREHMGMVSTTVVHGKSVQLIREEHYARPTVPFLGTFILDITYLLAAFKSSPHATQMAPENEPRIHEVLHTLSRFQNGPRYTPSLPSSFLKSSQKHHFRPAISNALHRGASRIQRISSGNIFGFDSNTTMSSNASNISSTNDRAEEEEDGNLDEQQKMATQYILMRSWVSQNTVDELSHLREPPLAKPNAYVPRSSSSGPTSMNRSSSVFSNSSSNVRFSTGSVSINTDSRPASVEDEEEERKRQQNGIFSFKRSDSQRPLTIHEGSGLSQEQDHFHLSDEKPFHTPPLVPPRPNAALQNDELKAALAQRLAKVNQK